MYGAEAGSAGSWDQHLEKVLEELRRLYMTHVRSLELAYSYDHLKPSWFQDSVVQKKPFVTFLGPFSAGKSTFINYLMQANYLLTGPHPVTDKFTCIFHGDEVQPVPGRVLIADAGQPFRGLQQFGDQFVECFGGFQAPHAILNSISIIDTPGVLEAAEGIHGRRYDFVRACSWFVERSDLIFFLFDPSKLDAGVELRQLFTRAVKGFENRVRIVLNKADSVTPQELMRVYGSAFWNLATLMRTTEPPRVYVSSFWDKPYRPGTDHQLFTDEKADLLYELIEVVPLQALDKRVTNVLRRAQDVLIHSLVCAEIRSSMPWFFGKDRAKAEALAKLPQTMQFLADKHQLSINDFVSPRDYKAFFGKVDLFAMPDYGKLNKTKAIETLKQVISTTIPSLLKPIKSAPVVDPRDRKRTILMQREYQQRIAAQLEGRGGIQGSLGEMAAPSYMGNMLVGNVAAAAAAAGPMAGMGTMMMQQQPQHQQLLMSPSSMMGLGAGMIVGTPVAGSCGMDLQQQILLLQMQTQLQQQHWQQQQPQARPVFAVAAPVPVPATVAAPDGAAGAMDLLEQQTAAPALGAVDAASAVVAPQSVNVSAPTCENLVASLGAMGADQQQALLAALQSVLAQQQQKQEDAQQ
jgi:GTPase SAR1 family protein